MQGFRGDYLKEQFNHLSPLDSVTVRINVHEPRDSNCRCIAEWVNKKAVLVERLHNELSGASA
jgi:hypothetical protein